MNTKIGLILRLNQLGRLLSTAAKARGTHYDLLGISPTATAMEIKQAYYEKTKLYHPDVVEPTEENLRIFRQISEAYEVLGSGPSRKEYDENVLGLVEKDDSTDTEVDPIAAYMRRTAQTGISDTWTRDYCEHLRKQQAGFHAAAINKSEKQLKNSDSAFITFFPVAVLLLICLIQMRKKIMPEANIKGKQINK